jgi:uncharacterized membrane protein YeaQ/YmgE (transglycosylase-associated protein family)
MNFIIWLIVGGVIGWLASILMKTDGQQDLFLNVVVGIVGAMLGGWVLSPVPPGCGALTSRAHLSCPRSKRASAAGSVGR